MRLGVCTVQETLATEAASVLKHSLSLARRRGHGQVTPLHVAATLLLSSRTSILRRACIKSQNNVSFSSHITPPIHHQNPHVTPTTPQPLHCRALELCFNVALNRLPTTHGPLLHGQPSLSNALIAALKRAQAQQRKGCIEQIQQTQSHQQQKDYPPLLAIKVELEQLILSILDDPSVSRVMREAGFSSTCVKTNLLDYQDYQNANFYQTHFLNHSHDQNPSPKSDNSLEKDVTFVMEVLLGKKSRKNTVIIGDSLSITEGVVRELMRKVERGDVPYELKCVHFIKFEFSSLPLKFMKREEVEMNVADLRRKVEALLSTGGGVIIYAGDLKWAVDEREVTGYIYNPVDHLILEIGMLISQYNVTNKVWLIGTANYQTFMKFNMMQPSLEVQWCLQAVSVPSAGLGLSLNVTTTSGDEAKIDLSKKICEEMVDRKPLLSIKEGGEYNKVMMSCCEECNSNYEKEAAAASAAAATTKQTSAILPFWIRHSTRSLTFHNEHLVELRKKWTSLCQSLHQGRHKLSRQNMNSTSLISSRVPYPFWPNNYNRIKVDPSFGNTLKPQSLDRERTHPRFRRQQSCHADLSYSRTNNQKVDQEPNLDCLKSRDDDQEVKITLGLGNSVSNLSKQQGLYKCLQESVPWHSEKMHSIVELLMSSSLSKAIKKDIWFLIEGNDSIGKRRLAMAIAKAMFGSSDSLLCFNMRGSSNECENLERALKDQENVVVMVEDADYGDGNYLKSLSEGFEYGKFGKNGQVIFVLSKGDHFLDDAKRSRISPVQMKLVVSEMSPTSEIFQKRKPKWDSDELSKRKVLRIQGEVIDKDLSRQSRSNTLDLNLKAKALGVASENPLDISPNSSDLTREMDDGSPRSPLGFLEMVKTKLVFNRSPARDSFMRDSLLFKMKGVFEVVFGSIESHLKVDEMVLDEVMFGCGVYLNGLFEKWLKEVFQTTLEVVKNGGKGVNSVRVCMVIDEKGGGIGIQKKDEGFMGTNLPNNFEICFIK